MLTPEPQGHCGDGVKAHYYSDNTHESPGDVNVRLQCAVGQRGSMYVYDLAGMTKPY